MASYVPKLFSINLNEHESNKAYTISVTADEIEHLETDSDCASLKLLEAKDLEYAEFISERDAKIVEALDPELVFDESPEEFNKSASEDCASKWAHEVIFMLLDEYQKQKSDFHNGKISQKNYGWELAINYVLTVTILQVLNASPSL